MRIEGSAAEVFGEVLRTRETGGFVVRESRYPGGLTMPFHHHPSAYLCYVVRGGITERDRHVERVYDAGSVHFHPAEDPHTGWTGAQGLTTLSVVPSERARALIERAAPRRGPVAPELSTLAARMVREFHAGDSASELAIEGLALEMVAAVARAAVRGSRRPPAWLDLVRDALHERFAERLAIGELARLAGVHEVHLVRAFRLHHGCTPGAYVRRLRLEAARGALARDGRPIVDIALDAGYSSQAHFTRAFCREVGLPPAAWRRLHRARRR